MAASAVVERGADGSEVGRAVGDEGHALRQPFPVGLTAAALGYRAG